MNKTPEFKSPRTFVLLVLIILIAGGGFVIARKNLEQKSSLSTPQNTASVDTRNTPVPDAAGTASAPQTGLMPNNLVPNTRKASKIEILSVAASSEDKVDLKAQLTYPDGSKDNCEWSMKIKRMDQGNASGLSIVPDESSSHCTPSK